MACINLAVWAILALPLRDVSAGCDASDAYCRAQSKSVNLLQRGGLHAEMSSRVHEEGFSETNQEANAAARATIEAVLSAHRRDEPETTFEDDSTFNSRNITLSIDAALDTFKHGTPFPVTVKVENGGSIDYVMMTWESPFEDEEIVNSLFQTSLKSQYLGRVMERWTAPLDSENTALLPAGGSLTATFDLGKYVRFLSKGETQLYLEYDFLFFEVQDASSLDNALKELGPGKNEENALQADIYSNEITFAVADAATPSETQANVSRSTGLKFNQCSEEQKRVGAAAAKLATEMCASSQQYLAAKREEDDWKEWFGSADPLWEDKVTTGIKNIHKVLVDESWIFDCTCTRQGVYAYVYPTDSTRKVYLCSPVFYQAPAGKARDSQPGTIIHEIAHFDVIMDTNDFAYGTRNIHKLAKDSPEKARKNSDSVEAYTEDKDLPLLRGSPTTTTTTAGSAPSPPGAPTPAPAPGVVATFKDSDGREYEIATKE